MSHNNTKENITIATWNLCLGLANKKDMVTQIIMEQEIDICVLQEIEVASDCDSSLLSFKGYNLLTEKNDVKSRTGIYVRNGIKFTRKCELEGLNSGDHSLITMCLDNEMKPSPLISYKRDWSKHDC